MIDAAGAIYVLGGYSFSGTSGTTLYNDVWVSTDGGAPPDSGKGGGRGVLKGDSRRGTRGYLRGTSGVLRGY